MKWQLICGKLSWISIILIVALEGCSFWKKWHKKVIFGKLWLTKCNKTTKNGPINYFWNPELKFILGKSFKIGCIKYKKSTITNQSIIKKSISLLMGPKRVLVKSKHVLKMVDFWKPVNYIMVDLVIFDTP